MGGVCAYLIGWWGSDMCIQMCGFVLSVDVCDYGEVVCVL